MTREMGISRSGDSDILIAEFAPRLDTPDFEGLIANLPLESVEVLREPAAQYLMNHFQELIPASDLPPLDPARLREALPDSLALYRTMGKLGGYKKEYMLGWEMSEGTLLIPNNRLKEVGNVREDIRPFIAFCNTVKIESSIKVVSFLTSMELDLVNYLGSRFPYPVRKEELIQLLWGDKDVMTFDREKSLWVHICKLRGKIGRFQDGAMALYQIYQFKQYLLSPKLEVGKWIVPQDRTEKLQEFREEIRPFMEFFSQVEVSNSKRLVSRLTPTEFSILSLIGEMFPSFVERDVLIDQIWRDAPVRINLVSAFNIQMSRLRGKISAFQNGAFTIPNIRQGPRIAGRHGLVRREDIEYSG